MPKKFNYILLILLFILSVFGFLFNFLWYNETFSSKDSIAPIIINQYLGIILNVKAIGVLGLSCLYILLIAFKIKLRFSVIDKIIMLSTLFYFIAIGLFDNYHTQALLLLIPFQVFIITSILMQLRNTTATKTWWIILAFTLFNFSLIAGVSYLPLWLNKTQNIHINEHDDALLTKCLFEFLENKNGSFKRDVFLVNGEKAFYYITNLKGRYYDAETDAYYTHIGAEPLLANTHFIEVRCFLGAEEIKYVISSAQANIENTRFNDFLADQAVLIKTDLRGNQLYKLK
jgi:hypothetical protein